MPRISTSKNDGRHCFFFDENEHFYLLFINNLKNLTVITVIKIYKRSLNGTTIYTRNCLIGNWLIQNFLLSLEKYREVVISGTIPKSEPDVPITVVGENAKSFILQKKSDLKFVSNDVKPSTRFKRKANSTEGGKWKVVCCHWNMDSNSDSIIHSSSLWCNGRKVINFSARGISCNNYVWGNFSKQDGDDFHEGLTSDCHTLLVFKETLMTEEQTRARHDFFLRRYNISADPVVWNHEACLHIQRLWISQVILLNSGVMISDNNATRMKSPHKKINTPITWQENRSREYYSHSLQNSRVETLWILFTCEKFKLSWNQGWLEYVHKTVFRKSRLISRLTWDRGKISWVALKSLLFSKYARIPLLYLLVSTFLLDILSMIF